MLDSPVTVEPDSMKKKPEPKACLSYSINQILIEVEVRSWDTESQVALSEEDNEEEKEEEKEEDKEEESKEKVQVRGFSNSITDVFDIHEEEGGNNCMFRALSRTTFGSPNFHKEIRAQVVDYMTVHRERFSAGQNDFEGYLILLRNYQAWDGHQELQAFAELYSVNIDVYDLITSSNPMYHISSGLNRTQTIKLFYAGDHYDSLIPRDAEEALQICKRKYWKVKSKDFIKKEESKLIRRKNDDRFANDYSTNTANELFRSISNYWNDGSYSKKITDIKDKKKRKETKRCFRRLAWKLRRFKVEKSKTGDLKLFKNLKFRRYAELKKEALINDEEYSECQEITTEQEIEAVTKYAENKNISIEKIFDWREIPREEYKNEIIYKAHTFHKGHLKAGNTLR